MFNQKSSNLFIENFLDKFSSSSTYNWIEWTGKKQKRNLDKQCWVSDCAIDYWISKYNSNITNQNKWRVGEFAFVKITPWIEVLLNTMNCGVDVGKNPRHGSVTPVAPIRVIPDRKWRAKWSLIWKHLGLENLEKHKRTVLPSSSILQTCSNSFEFCRPARNELKSPVWRLYLKPLPRLYSGHGF